MAEHDTEFAVDGVESESDREAVDTELRTVEGVSAIEWNENDDVVNVMFDYDILAAEEIKRTVRELGYGVDDEE